MNNISHLLIEIDRHETISFDIFDTLIVRDVLRPTDIFDIVEYVYNKEAVKKIDFFKEKRVQAEKEARKSKNTEVTLQDIYACLLADNSIKPDLKKIELQMESVFSTANTEIKYAYEYALKKNKRVIITSDMYLDYDFIHSLLIEKGYKNFDFLYLSSKIGKRKKDGSLFKHIIADLKCEPDTILHIGDNRKSDIMEAQKVGIRTFKVKKKFVSIPHYSKKVFATEPIQNRVYLSFINNRKTILQDDAQYLGFYLLGLPLMAFCQWLHDAGQHMEKFFLARDGFLIKQAYDEMYPQEKASSHYLLISRKALRGPNLYSGIDFESFVEQLPSSKKSKGYDYADFLDFCGVTNEQNGKLKQFEGLKIARNKEELLSIDEYKELFEKIKIIKKDDYRRSYENLVKYLSQEKFCGNVAIVDVGWRGTAQINLHRICQDTIRSEGFYFGLENSGSVSDEKKDMMHGYFWGWNEKCLISERLLNGNKFIFEAMFLADVGSTYGYYEDDKGIVHPKLEEKRNCDEAHVAKRIQEGALLFVRDFKKYQMWLPVFDEHCASAAIADFLKYPTKKDMVIGDIVTEDNRVAYIAKPQSVAYYFKNPGTLFEDFRNSGWKVGFLRRLCPMNKQILDILNFLYNRVHMKHG